MRELDRHDLDTSECARSDARAGGERGLPAPSADLGDEPGRLAVVGRGRLGVALAGALREAGFAVDGPLGRGAAGEAADAVLLCVPDSEIAAAAGAVAPGPLVGHCSGALGTDAIPGHPERFALHPLMTVTASGARFPGAGAAVAGSTPRALAAAVALATALGMRPFAVADADRAAYHAAASVASNFLVTLEAAAERLASAAGADRTLLAPLVRATVENWERLGPQAALTGPLVRGDEETVARQRAAVAERAPELLDLFDALASAPRRLAGRPPPRGPRRMRTVGTVADLRAALAPHRRAGRTIGLVPTMGAFHDGHLSLIRAARERCDVVVVSLFVNPAQFGPGEDLAAYPRDEARDADLAEAERADLLFAPPVEEVYPDGFATTVHVGGLTETLEGERRPGHFDGVATVVLKLLNAVQPDIAFFGRKDAQQAVVIRRLVRDLDLAVEIDVRPTVRDADGLALSSRNAYLSPGERERALALPRALRAVERAAADGLAPREALAAGRAELAAAGVEPEYLEAVSAQTLRPAEDFFAQDVLVAVAARVGRARLIDNIVVPAGDRRPEHGRQALECSA
jgi:pantoate--beta-alanine ligase